MALVKRVEESGPWAQLYGYSRAVAVGPLVVTSACTADVENRPALLDDPGAQAREAFRTALDAMVHAGASVADVVRSRLYVTDPAYADPVGRVHGEFFGVVKPTATVVTVAQLFHPGQLVAVELEAFRAWRDLQSARFPVRRIGDPSAPPRLGLKPRPSPSARASAGSASGRGGWTAPQPT